MIARSCIGVNRKMGKCFWGPGRRRTAGAARRRRLCLRFRPPGEKRSRRGGKMAAGCGGGSGLCCGGMAAGCYGRGRQRAAADGDGSGLCCGDGRQAVRRSRTPPPPEAGAGSAPEGRRACRPYCCGAQRPARKKKTRPGKPQFSGPGLVLIDSPCARSGVVFPPGSGQGRWYRRGSW